MGFCETKRQRQRQRQRQRDSEYKIFSVASVYHLVKHYIVVRSQQIPNTVH